MADTILFPRRLVERLIELYRSLPCLWERSHPHYKVKMKRHQAVSQLTQLVQEFEPSATRVHVLRKIESLRACVRREHRRVADSRRAAASPRDLYAPSLWYYHLLSFIVPDDDTDEHYKKGLVSVTPDQEDQESETGGSGDEDQQESFDEEFSSEYNIVDVAGAGTGAGAGRRRRGSEDGEPSAKRNKPATVVVDDEYDAIGINVAAKLRNLSSSQRILAEKLVNDVLYQAQVGALAPATCIYTPDPFKQDSH